MGFSWRYYLPANKPYLWQRPLTFMGRRLLVAMASRFNPAWLDQTRVASLLCASSSMEVTPRDLIGRSIYCNGVFEYPLTRLLRTALRPGDVFVDVGANAGYHSLIASDCVGPEGRVLACEPAPVIRARLERNLARNHIANVEILPVALCDREGSVELHVDADPSNSGLSSLVRRSSSTEAVRVPATTLDALCERLPKTPALVKIDVEGGEPAVLRGARRLLGREDSPCVVFEALPGSDGEPFELLREAGYQIRRLGFWRGKPAFPALDVEVWNPFDYDAPSFVAAKPGWRGKGIAELGPLLDGPQGAGA